MSSGLGFAADSTSVLLLPVVTDVTSNMDVESDEEADLTSACSGDVELSSTVLAERDQVGVCGADSEPVALIPRTTSVLQHVGVGSGAALGKGLGGVGAWPLPVEDVVWGAWAADVEARTGERGRGHHTMSEGSGVRRQLESGSPLSLFEGSREKHISPPGRYIVVFESSLLT